jgi:hypothetical protein
MFKGTINPRISVNDIKRLDQESMFFNYLGIKPDNRKHYSPFRKDNNPGCTFKWYNGLLYFMDNGSFNGKLSWSIIDVVMYQNNCTFVQALEILSKDYKPAQMAFDTTYQKSYSRLPLQIRFKPKNFENLFGFSQQVLEKEHVYIVDDYWIGRNDMKQNIVHNPKTNITVAYHFPNSDHVKLYWPELKENRFYSNCNIYDVFGYDKIDYYQSIDDRYLIITKSQKDRLVLDYDLGFNSIAVQNEGCSIPDDIINKIRSKFEYIYLLYDNDETGKIQSKKISEEYGFINLNLIKYKDPYQWKVKEQQNDLKRLLLQQMIL